MQRAKFPCDPDKVIEMEEMGIGVGEILQYARALLSPEELEDLARGLQEFLASAPERDVAWCADEL